MVEEKKELSKVVFAEPNVPDFTKMLQSEDLSVAQKRSHVLEGLGLKGKKRKYKSVEERKQAAKKRREERKSTRLEALKKYGIEPKKKGPKLTKEQKRVRRSARSKRRRSFMREMAKSNPELAEKYGIDISRFKL